MDMLTGLLKLESSAIHLLRGKPTMSKAHLFHPFAFSIFTALSFYAANVKGTPLIDTIPVLIFGTILGFIIWLLCHLATASSEKASVGATLGLAIFFSYTYINEWIGDPGLQIVRHRHLIPFFFLLQTTVLILLRRYRRPLGNLTKALNVTGGAMIAMPIISILSFHVSGSNVNKPETLDARIHQYVSIDSLRTSRTSVRPDIYFVILDSYSRADVLKTKYEYDNGYFLDSLKQRGFYIASKSSSNYCWTNLSLPASLNFSYYPKTGNSVNHSPMLMASNRLFAFLSSIGYKTVSYPDPMDIEIKNADVFHRNALSFMNNYPIDYFTSTPLDLVLNLGLKKSFSTPRTNQILDHIMTVPNISEPTVTFAHVMSPHWPYSYGLTYHEELDSLNKRVLEVVDTILTRSTKPPIIVLQADHGYMRHMPSRGKLSGRSVAEIMDIMSDGFGILNAIRLPDGGSEGLYDTISPINTWRVILNHQFGTKLPLLEDRSVFTWSCRQTSAGADITSILTSSIDSTSLRKLLTKIDASRPDTDIPEAAW
jgi:hypothetical protein